MRTHGITHFQMVLAKSCYVFGIKIRGQATRTSNFSLIAPKVLIPQLSEGLGGLLRRTSSVGSKRTRPSNSYRINTFGAMRLKFDVCVA